MASQTGDDGSGADVELQEPRDQPVRIDFSSHLDISARESISSVPPDEIHRPDVFTNKLRREWSNQLFNVNLTGFSRKKEECGTWGTLVLAFQSLGVVFGDLGTSPLYVYPTIQLSNNPTEADLLGILSIIFWTMTLVALIKYVFIVLTADDHGEGPPGWSLYASTDGTFGWIFVRGAYIGRQGLNEIVFHDVVLGFGSTFTASHYLAKSATLQNGGTFAVYSLLCQYANIGPNAGMQSVQVQSDRQLANFTKGRNLGKRNGTVDFLESSSNARRVLLVVVIVGVCMVFGDGVLTPAISVLSAIGGIRTEFPAITQSVVIFVSAAIILALFGFQRFGTKTVSFLFSPIMALWCITGFGVGLYNIAVHGPHVFKAVSPHYIILFFRHNHKSAWVALGGSVLCITGRGPIRYTMILAFCQLSQVPRPCLRTWVISAGVLFKCIAFLTMIYPSCMLSYAGETAFLIKYPEHHSDAFFKSIPPGLFWPVFIISTLAAVVASQSLISASFSVVKQAMALGCFPRVTLVHTSTRREGQVYSPEINYTIMVLCLLVVAGFRDAVQIGNAFGVTVVFVMFLTTCLLVLVMLIVWETPLYFIVPFLVVYGFIEGVYLTSVLYKFPQGGWVPFAISFFFGVIMLSWNYGHKKKVEYELQTKLSADELASLLTSSKIQRVPGICFFYTNLALGIPPMITHYVKNVRTLHQVIIFITIRHVPVVSVLPSERFLVSRIGHRGVYRCVARYGYTESVSIEGGDFKEKLLESLRDYLQNPVSYQARFSRHPFIREDFSEDDEQDLRSNFATEELEELAASEREEIVYVLGNTKMSVSSKALWWKKLVLEKIYTFLQNNCRKAYDQLKIPPSNLLEVGMVYDVE